MTNETATALAEPTDDLAKPNAHQQNRPFQKTVRISKLVYENREFTFTHEMAVKITWDGEGWSYRLEDYGIEGSALEQQEAEFAFRQDFDACWEHIACAEDADLHESALPMKTSLLSLVASTRQINGYKDNAKN
jgi:hypothetical protein